MYQYARRLGSLSTFSSSDRHIIITIQTEQAQAYLTAMNSISFVEKESAWFSFTAQLDAATMEPAHKRRKVDLILTQSLAQLGMYIRKLIVIETHSLGEYVDVIDLQTMRREYALLLAKLDLASKFSDFSFSQGFPDPEDAFTLYIQAQKYQSALSLGRLFELPLTKVFTHLAEQCVRLSQRYDIATC